MYWARSRIEAEAANPSLIQSETREGKKSVAPFWISTERESQLSQHTAQRRIHVLHFMLFSCCNDFDFTGINQSRPRQIEVEQRFIYI